MVGEVSCIYDSAPTYNIFTNSCSTLVRFDQKVIFECLKRFPSFSQKLKKNIHDNPFNYERDYVVSKFK